MGLKSLTKLTGFYMMATLAFNELSSQWLILFRKILSCKLALQGGGNINLVLI